ncbi:hypothetical protein GUJ93_ZPchr0012g21036 [Zizania palustris]|uniref:NAD-dependent epimerase/dehydratase domain-containing protein n=1 Tax=Zizania palustris TaxID=103762 RepID=A0A8J6BWM4_ZIZPA|nr:hypothetical protein GUJ93_ZPchr0012g21036 [Zizania palustris]
MSSQRRSIEAVDGSGDGAMSFLDDKSAKVFVAGHRGMVGSAVYRKLEALGFTNVVVRTLSELDLAFQPAVDAFFDAKRPRATSSLPRARSTSSTARQLFLRRRSEAYSGEFGFDAIVAAPNNLYGRRDPFPSERSHVIPALIRRFHHAKATGAAEVAVWGSRAPFREFTHVDDIADALVVLIDRYSGAEHVNVGSGSEVSVRELAEAVREVVGYEGHVAWDASWPGNRFLCSRLANCRGQSLLAHRPILIGRCEVPLSLSKAPCEVGPTSAKPPRTSVRLRSHLPGPTAWCGRCWTAAR